VRGLEPARRDFRRQLQRPLSEGASERVAARVHVGIAERRRGRARERAEVGTPGRVEDERHLGQSPRPATPRLGAELALDDAADDRVLALGFDLIRDDEAARPRGEELDRAGLHGFPIEEPARPLRELGERRRLVIPPPATSRTPAASLTISEQSAALPKPPSKRIQSAREPLPSTPETHARAARSGARSTTGRGAGRAGAVTPRCARR